MEVGSQARRAVLETRLLTRAFIHPLNRHSPGSEPRAHLGAVPAVGGNVGNLPCPRERLGSPKETRRA